MSVPPLALEISVKPLEKSPAACQAAVQEATALKNFIDANVTRQDNIVTRQLREETQPGKAGAILASALSVLLGKELMGKLADIVKTWITQRPKVIDAKKTRLELSFTPPGGKAVKIKVETREDLDNLLQEIKALTTQQQ